MFYLYHSHHALVQTFRYLNNTTWPANTTCPPPSKLREYFNFLLFHTFTFLGYSISSISNYSSRHAPLPSHSLTHSLTHSLRTRNSFHGTSFLPAEQNVHRGCLYLLGSRGGGKGLCWVVRSRVSEAVDKCRQNMTSHYEVNRKHGDQTMGTGREFTGRRREQPILKLLEICMIWQEKLKNCNHSLNFVCYSRKISEQT
jgi:hypothetical protein